MAIMSASALSRSRIYAGPINFASQSISDGKANARAGEPACSIAGFRRKRSTPGCFPMQGTHKMRPSCCVGVDMLKSLVVACLFQTAVVSVASAAGPFGTIHVGAWNGGAYTDDNTGAFSHCAAGSEYASGVSLIVSQTASNSWLLGFGSTAFHFTKGATR